MVLCSQRAPEGGALQLLPRSKWRMLIYLAKGRFEIEEDEDDFGTQGRKSRRKKDEQEKIERSMAGRPKAHIKTVAEISVL